MLRIDAYSKLLTRTYSRRPHSDEYLSRRTLPTLASGLSPVRAGRPEKGRARAPYVRRVYCARAPSTSSLAVRVRRPL